MLRLSLRYVIYCFIFCQVTTVLAQPTVLFVVGDTGECDLTGTEKVAAAVRAQSDAAMGTLVEVGDLAYPAATRDQLLKCHEPYWGIFKKRLAVPGNHDWRDPGAAGFFSLFPDPVPRKVGLGGRWQLLMIDSNLRSNAWEAQLKWLDETLKQSQRECLIAAWHHPRWSSGEHGDNAFTQALWQRMQGKVTLTLHGHDHHFEALPPLNAQGNIDLTGVASFIVGNGGAGLYQAGKQRHSMRAIFGRWGFLHIELDGDRYRWQEIDDSGKIMDFGIGHCRH
jgi:hypothetical protein